MNDVITKKDFAALVGVTPGRVSQWLAEKKLCGAALVGMGCRARVRVSVAREQLKRTLDLSQRLGANGKAKLGAASPLAAEIVEDIVESKIKQERLTQLSLANAKAREAAAVRSGHYVKSEDARREMGRITSRLMTIFEASLMEFGNAIVAHAPASPRDALRVLRATWREIRIRQAKSNAAEAAALPPLLEDQGGGTDV